MKKLLLITFLALITNFLTAQEVNRVKIQKTYIESYTNITTLYDTIIKETKYFIGGDWQISFLKNTLNYTPTYEQIASNKIDSNESFIHKKLIYHSGSVKFLKTNFGEKYATEMYFDGDSLLTAINFYKILKNHNVRLITSSSFAKSVNTLHLEYKYRYWFFNKIISMQIYERLGEHNTLELSYKIVQFFNTRKSFRRSDSKWQLVDVQKTKNGKLKSKKDPLLGVKEMHYYETNQKHIIETWDDDTLIKKVTIETY